MTCAMCVRMRECVLKKVRVQLIQLIPMLRIPRHSAAINAAGHDLRHVRTCAYV